MRSQSFQILWYFIIFCKRWQSLPYLSFLLLLKPVRCVHHTHFHMRLQFRYHYEFATFWALLGLWTLKLYLLFLLLNTDCLPLIIVFNLHIWVQGLILKDLHLGFGVEVLLILLVFKILLVLDLRGNLVKFKVYVFIFLSVVFFEKVYCLNHYEVVPIDAIVIL